MIIAGGSLYYYVLSPGATYSYELWKISPSFEATLVSQQQSTGRIRHAVLAGNETSVVFGVVHDGFELAEIWKAGVATGDIIPLIEFTDSISASYDQRQYAVTSEKMLFIARDRIARSPFTVTGTELWISDFTKAGTRLAVDFNEGSDGGVPSDNLIALNEASVMLTANYKRKNTTAPYVYEPWVSDGSAIGTVGLVDPETRDARRNIRIYPNPASGSITVEGFGEKGVLTDIAGQKLMDINGDGTIDISALPAGIYFIRGTLHTAKLIKI
jgi:ELWxxDGT repeat protein